jgi:hypothetical protein
MDNPLKKQLLATLCTKRLKRAFTDGLRRTVKTKQGELTAKSGMEEVLIVFQARFKPEELLGGR